MREWKVPHLSPFTRPMRVCDIYGRYELHPPLSRGNWDGKLLVVTLRQVDVLISLIHHFLIKCRLDEIIRHVTTLIECLTQIPILICWGRLIRVAVKISTPHENSTFLSSSGIGSKMLLLTSFLDTITFVRQSLLSLKMLDHRSPQTTRKHDNRAHISRRAPGGSR